MLTLEMEWSTVGVVAEGVTVDDEPLLVEDWSDWEAIGGEKNPPPAGSGLAYSDLGE